MYIWSGCAEAGMCGWVCTRVCMVCVHVCVCVVGVRMRVCVVWCALVCVWCVCTGVRSYTLDQECVSAEVMMRWDIPFLVLFLLDGFPREPAREMDVCFFSLQYVFILVPAEFAHGVSLVSGVRGSDSPLPHTARPSSRPVPSCAGHLFPPPPPPFRDRRTVLESQLSLRSPLALLSLSLDLHF